MTHIRMLDMHFMLFEKNVARIWSTLVNSLLICQAPETYENNDLKARRTLSYALPPRQNGEHNETNGKIRLSKI